MKRNAPTWFGFTLTQKQAVSLFVFALLGVLICGFIFIMSFTSVYTSYYYMTYDPYYMDDGYMNMMFISQLPLIIFFFVIFLICCYTLSRCRKTAKYYNQQNRNPQAQIQTQGPSAQQIKVPKVNTFYEEKLFCPNCGTKHNGSHQYCVNCGFELN